MAGLLLMTALQATAQTVTKPVKVPADLYVTAAPTKGTSTNDGTTLFCAENSGFTLKSSTTDPVTHATYTGYTWEEQQTGAATFGPVTSGTATNETLVITSATPGWHTYRVTAALAGNACPPEPAYYNVYVLPKLVVTASSNKADAASHTYCAENGAPTAPADAITFTGSVAFDGTPNALPGLENLTINDFEVTYTWQKINVATSAATTVASTKDYTIVEAATPGATTTTQYTYELTAAYSVKACGTYKGTATLNGSTTTATVTVTPKPGKPTITIQ
ncbi:hypothetical protein SAMN05421788_103464 [Filimonas lacunae]|uniref:Uncharacterized protein n=2 Tax=Filimonas lacunae TaxID=477680 RepID=A0A1N7PH85_9BACT|nr:hypothetical protein SAMN05421788_103464 [Filimonas lacunae]